MSVLNSRPGWASHFGLILLVVLWAAAPVKAQTPISKEYQVKAVCLFNLAQFINWPSDAFRSPDEPFYIGILGEDPFGAYLDETVQGEKIDGHPLAIRRYARIEDVKDCQLLFISASENDRMKAILSALRDRDILTIGETKGFCDQGGIIRLFIQDNRIHFKINVEAAKRGNLSISSKVLRLAEIYHHE